MAVGHTQSRLADTARLVLVGLVTVACAVSPAPTPIASVTPIPTRTTGPTPVPTPTPGQTAQPTPTLAPSPTPEATSGLSSTGGNIAFFSSRDGGPEVYVIGADGSNQLRLTRLGRILDDCPTDLDLAWSPDGSRIAFSRGCGDHWQSDTGVFGGGNREIFVMDADGADLANLTNNDADDCDPAWSPDGSKIAFASPCNGKGQIYVIDADGSDFARLTNNCASDSNPIWSPDGNRIAFMSVAIGWCWGDGSQTGEARYRVYVMNADGSARRRLTKTGAVADESPAWSPDGSRIAFVAHGEDGDSQIYLMTADGSSVVNLTNNDLDPRCDCNVQDTDPAWSPDGSRIAFRSDRDGDNDIYVMNADGTNVVNVTNNPWEDQALSWSPDGSHIASAAGFDALRIYVANADGSGMVRITQLTPGVYDGSPAWSPVVSP